MADETTDPNLLRPLGKSPEPKPSPLGNIKTPESERKAEKPAPSIPAAIPDGKRSEDYRAGYRAGYEDKKSGKLKKF